MGSPPACGALPFWAERPTATVTRLSQSAPPSDIISSPSPAVTSFESLVGRSSRLGVSLSLSLVESCVLGCLPQMASLSTTSPSVIQAECWQWALAMSPPDLVAISPTGSGKTLAFLLPAMAEAIGKQTPAHSREASSSAQGDTEARAPLSLADARTAAKAAAAAAWKEALANGASRSEAKQLMLTVAEKAFREQTNAAADARHANQEDEAPRADVSLGVGCRPTVLILAPTRELCEQTGRSATRVANRLRESGSPSVKVEHVLGGVDFNSQRASLLGRQPEVLVATPGRLLALCGELPSSSRARGKEPAPCDDAAVHLDKVTLLILDEADRLLDMGFEEDLRRILALVRPNATESKPWVLMFSATWGPQIKELADVALSDGAIQISIGSDEPTAAVTIQQHIEIMRGKGAPRLRRLCVLLEEYLGTMRGRSDGTDGEEEDDTDSDESNEGNGIDEAGLPLKEGADLQKDNTEAEEPIEDGTPRTEDGASQVAGPRIVVFTVYKKEAKDVARLLCERGFSAAALQGDMTQRARALAMDAFRDGRAQVLVATDVAARGLDIRGVTHVINYSLGTSVEQYVHRIGRCGRAGETGTSHTFLIDDDIKHAPELVALLQRSKQHVPPELLRLCANKEKTSQPTMDGDEEAERIAELRVANRQRQQLEQQSRKQKQHSQQNRRLNKR